MKLFSISCGEYDDCIEFSLGGPQEMTEDEFVELCDKVFVRLKREAKERGGYYSNYDVIGELRDTLVKDFGFIDAEWCCWHTSG